MSSRIWTETHQPAPRRTTTDGVLTVFLRGVAESFRRARQRRQLAALPEHLLRDIGLGRGDAEIESSKPFWRP